MRNHLTRLSRCLELIFCVAFTVISGVMFVFHKTDLGILYFVSAIPLSPIPIMRRLPSGIRFGIVMLGVFL